ncbi:MAG: polysaccharide pyruvyl transferase family protein [Spirochaetes bacterium]|nr:MAG: polysaccharide pyruvyl transferase family protein [Spirochaetota bacterium]
MNIACITTVNYNVGDDFVREGISYLLAKRFGEIKVYNIHKHIPVTVRREFEWIYLSGLMHIIDKLPGINGRRLSNVLDSVPRIKFTDKILKADLLVQCGAPLYWCHQGGPHCANNEWFAPLIQRRYLNLKNYIPFLNLAVGTCQKYYSDGSEFANCGKCSSYIKEIYNIAKITTVRDKLAKTVLNLLGLDAPLIPCPSIFARDRLDIKEEKPRYICLNYMRLGGHYDFGQHIDENQWEETFRSFYNAIKSNDNCIFVCHNKRELQDVKRIDPHARTFFSKDYKEYLNFYAHAKCGVVNRLHSAFAIASFGRPSFIIGTDSRTRMAEEIGLHHAFVPEVSASRLLDEFEYMLKKGKEYQEMFFSIKSQAYKDYMSVLESLS